MPGPLEITPEQLLRLIGTPECPKIIDLTLDEDHGAEIRLIPSAIRWSHHELDRLANDLVGQKVIFLCHKGKKLSQSAASWLRASAIDAEYLKGGNAAWRSLGYPTIALSKLPKGPGKDQHQALSSLWVTRHRPKIDRIACPWLIRRFIDPNARFLFVAPSEVTAAADLLSATVFDLKDSYWGHRDELCSFDTFPDEFDLRTPPLNRMARIIRAADTNQLDKEPEAAGILALSIRLSRQYKDDQAQLVAGLSLYDALYRWARDGTTETHSWPSGHS